MAWNVEVTDTFGGEANYCWVRRYKIMDAPDSNGSKRAIVRQAKAKAGWSGLRCETDSYGDSYTLRPRGMCQIMFINWADDPEPQDDTPSLDDSFHRGEMDID